MSSRAFSKEWACTGIFLAMLAADSAQASCLVAASGTYSQTVLEGSLYCNGTLQDLELDASNGSIAITGDLSLTGELLISDGTVSISSSLDAANLTVSGGATLVMKGTTSSTQPEIDVSGDILVEGTLTHEAELINGLNIIAENLDVVNGGVIDVSSKGCPGASDETENGYQPDYTSGICEVRTVCKDAVYPDDLAGCSGCYLGSCSDHNTQDVGGGGAGHAARGGRAKNWGYYDLSWQTEQYGFQGKQYGQARLPTTVGSGGGAVGVGTEVSAGGDGGGHVTITLTHNGVSDGELTVGTGSAILADGGAGAFYQPPGQTNTARGAGGGSGGSISITGRHLILDGEISVNGGDAGTAFHGGGAGSAGRIWLDFDTSDTASGNGFPGVVASPGVAAWTGGWGKGSEGSTAVAVNSDLNIPVALDLSEKFGEDAAPYNQEFNKIYGADSTLRCNREHRIGGLIAQQEMDLEDSELRCNGTADEIEIKSVHSSVDIFSSYWKFVGVADLYFAADEGLTLPEFDVEEATDLDIHGETVTWGVGGLDGTASSYFDVDTAFNMSFDTLMGSGTSTASFTNTQMETNWSAYSSSNMLIKNVILEGTYASDSNADAGIIFMDEPTVSVTLENSDIFSSIKWDVDTLSIDSDSSVDATAKGCAPSDWDYTSDTYLSLNQHYLDGFGPDTNGLCVQGATSAGRGLLNYGGSGAGFGGDGGESSHQFTEGQSVTCDPSNGCFFPGASGGGSAFDSGMTGAGGGRIWIEADTLTLNGSVKANGGNGMDITTSGVYGAEGGGSGGLIYLEADSYSGSGVVDSYGGDGGSKTPNYKCRDGAGGGGGITEIVPPSSGTHSYTTSVAGGSPGLVDGSCGTLAESGDSGLVL